MHQNHNDVLASIKLKNLRDGLFSQKHNTIMKSNIEIGLSLLYNSYEDLPVLAGKLSASFWSVKAGQSHSHGPAVQALSAGQGPGAGTAPSSSCFHQTIQHVRRWSSSLTVLPKDTSLSSFNRAHCHLMTSTSCFSQPCFPHWLLSHTSSTTLWGSCRATAQTIRWWGLCPCTSHRGREGKREGERRRGDSRQGVVLPFPVYIP